MVLDQNNEFFINQAYNIFNVYDNIQYTYDLGFSMLSLLYIEI